MKRSDVDLPTRFTLSKTHSDYGGIGDTILSSADQGFDGPGEAPTVEQLLDSASVTGKLLREIQQQFDPSRNVADILILYEMTGYRSDNRQTTDLWDVVHVDDDSSLK